MRAQEYYEATVKHRRLQWYYHHGYANLRGNFRSKPIDITASTTQAAVLLLFNAGARMPPSFPCASPLPVWPFHTPHRMHSCHACAFPYMFCSVFAFVHHLSHCVRPLDTRCDGTLFTNEVIPGACPVFALSIL